MTDVGVKTRLDQVGGDPELVATTRAVLEEGIHRRADAVRNSLNFYRMQPGSESVSSAVLVGPAVAIPGFAAALSAQLRMPVSDAIVAHGDAVADASRLAVAAGLAVESVG